jgi:mono/diheme cytochrome c family protein
MPRFNLTAEEAKIIASYLSTKQRDPRILAEIPDGPATAEEIQRGREIFQSHGCFSCHTVGEGPGGVVGPDLTIVRERLRPGYLWFHLKNPQAVDPYSAEPDYALPDEEARALAAYLSRRRE